MYDQGAISREEQDALMAEARKLNSGEASAANKSPDQQETELLDENYDKYVQINQTYPSIDEIFKMTEAEQLAVDEAKKQKQDARKTWLKEECLRIHGAGEAAEMCYAKGEF